MAKKTRKAVPSSQFLMVAALSAAFVLSLFVFNYPKQAQKSSAATTAPTTTTTTQVNGNGAPNGAHYNLNIIGVPKGKTATMTGGDAHRIFVPLVGNCKISLSMGAFQVLDGNCTDGPSSFQLPNPDPDNDGTTTYSVWARALGKPGGSSTQTTCATDVATGELYCSVYASVQVRSKGKSSFTDVSRELLYVYADLNGDGTNERYNLFNDALKDYYWNYDNNGLKLLQLRFYEVPSTVTP